MFHPAFDWSGNGSFTISIDDLGNSGTGMNKTYSVTIMVIGGSIDPNKYNPTLIVPEFMSIIEDTTLSMENISITFDADIVYNWLQFTLTSVYGSFSISGNQAYLIDNKTVTINDTDKSINSIIPNITYTPPLHFNDNEDDIETIKATIIDDTGYTSFKILLLTITSFNDAPVITLNKTTTFSENIDGLLYVQISDVDFDFKWKGKMQIILRVINGTLSLKNRRGLYFPGSDSYQNTSYINFKTSMKNVNTLLDGFEYHPSWNLLSSTLL